MLKHKASNLYGLKENNISAVLRCLHDGNHHSRISLAHATGLTQATITKIINQLMSWGIVSEGESMESVGQGRRPVRLALNAENYLIYSIRINRDYYNIYVYDIAGQCYIRKTYPIHETENAAQVLDGLCSMIEQIRPSLKAQPMAVGLALPGPLNISENRIALMSHFPGWEKINITEELQDRIHLPIYLDHDANCCALAEQWYGKHRDCDNIVYVLADRGVGAGFVLNGKLYHGTQGFSGEIGHMSINMYGPLCECGNRGCLEIYCSTVALENEYQRQAAESNLPKDVLRLSATQILTQVREQSNPIAVKVYKSMVHHLAFGIANIINTLNPEVIIFADKLVDEGGGEYFLSLMREALEKCTLKEAYSKLVISTSTLQENPVMLGASILVADHIFRTPLKFFPQNLS